jgi:hypothetical protein
VKKVLSEGPVLGDGWLSFYSGVPVHGSIEDGTESVLVSFGMRGAWQAERYASADFGGSFGSTVNFAFLAPYLDRFIVGRSRLSHAYPVNHGFTMSSLFSILWADRATAGRNWRGLWDGRDWLEYTGFDRKLPRWKIRWRSSARSQLVSGWGETLSDNNARLGAAFAKIIDNPGRLGDFALSEHDHERRVLRLHEMFIHEHRFETNPASPGDPSTVGQTHLAHGFAQADPERGLSGFALHLGLHGHDYQPSNPQPAVSLSLTKPR